MRQEGCYMDLYDAVSHSVDSSVHSVDFFFEMMDERHSWKRTAEGKPSRNSGRATTGVCLLYQNSLPTVNIFKFSYTTCIDPTDRYNCPESL